MNYTDNDNEYRLQAMNRKQAEREAKRETFGNGHKFDNLNGGRMRQEYVNEVYKAQQDSQNHTVQMSDGFKNWLSECYRNQAKERQDQVQNIKEQMFPVRRELSEFDMLLKENGNQRNINLQKNEMRERFRQSLFPDAEIDRRREKNEAERHPMDIAMREQLEKRRQNKSGTF